MGRAGHQRVVAAIVAVTTCVGVSAALAGGPDRSVKTKTEQIPTESAGSASPKCPNGSEATGIGFHVATQAIFGPQINTVNLVDERRGALYVDNKGSQEIDATAILLCRAKGSFSQENAAETVESGVESTVARCPDGSVVVGGGGSTSGGYDTQQVLQSRPQKNRAWKIRVLTGDVGEQNQVATAVCAKQGSYKTETDKDSIPRGSSKRTQVEVLEAQAKCDQGSSTISGGFSVSDSSQNMAMLDSGPKGNQKWLVKGRTGDGGQQKLVSYAICSKD